METRRLLHRAQLTEEEETFVTDVEYLELDCEAGQPNNCTFCGRDEKFVRLGELCPVEGAVPDNAGERFGAHGSHRVRC